MPEINTVMSWLEGLAQDDWREFHSDSEVQEIAKAALKVIEEQKKEIDRIKYLSGEMGKVALYSLKDVCDIAGITEEDLKNAPEPEIS